MRSIGLVLLLLPPVARAAEPTVGVVKAETRDLVRRVSVPGTVLASEQAMLVAHVTGYVREVLVREGARVKRGDPLATIDVPLLAEDLARAQAAVREAEAMRAASQAQAAVAEAGIAEREAAQASAEAEARMRGVRLARLRKLAAEKAATGEEVEAAEGEMAIAEAQVRAAAAAVQKAQATARAAAADIQRAEAAVASAKAELARLEATVRLARIECPYEEALVSRRHVDPAVLVRKDETPLLTVMSVARLRVAIDLDERDAIRVAPGTPLLLTPDALPAAAREAKVARVFGAIDPSTRTMRFEADLDNADGLLRPGMFVHADVTVFRRPGALVLPARCVMADKDGVFVYAVREGRARLQRVRIGVDDGVVVEIEEGVSAGEEVVASGKEGLADGIKVSTRPEKGA